MNKKTEWQPKGGEYLCHHTGFVVASSDGDLASEFNGCTYKTEKSAERAAKAMRAHNRLLAYVAEFAPDYEPDWLDGEYCVEYAHDAKEYMVDQNFLERLGCVYMPKCVAEELRKKLNSGEVVL